MLQLAGIALDAISVGGLETCIQLPGFDLSFDIGRCPRNSIGRSRVLFTHAHLDHMGGAVMHCATRSLIGATPPTYVMPADNVDAFEEMLAAWRRLDGSDLACTVIPARPGDVIELGKGLDARAFRSLHRVPCNGYTLWRSKQKLKPQFVGRPGSELRDARLAGVQITETIQSPEVAFTGDTRIEVVEREAAVRQARLLIMEVTFVDDRITVEQARSKGHIHLDEVIERAELFENQAILFTHLSARYRPEEAKAILDKRLPDSLKERVTLLPRSGSGRHHG